MGEHSQNDTTNAKPVENKPEPPAQPKPPADTSWVQTTNIREGAPDGHKRRD
jgi:hypothetical protein